MNSLCQTCRKLLYRTDPCRGDGVECGRTDGGSKQSTAAQKGAHSQGVVEPSRDGDAHRRLSRTVTADAEITGEVQRQRTETGQGGNGASRISHREPPAGTQAPPVDTKLGRPRDTGPSQGKSKRAAQMREYQRQRRANKKAKEGKNAQ